MNIKYAVISKAGKRQDNEDAYKIIEMPEKSRWSGIICDGMGGHAMGEVASQTVVDTISNFWNASAVCSGTTFSKTFPTNWQKAIIMIPKNCRYPKVCGNKPIESGTLVQCLPCVAAPAAIGEVARQSRRG